VICPDQTGPAKKWYVDLPEEGIVVGHEALTENIGWDVRGRAAGQRRTLDESVGGGGAGPWKK
jgi:hypothetical protein